MRAVVIHGERDVRLEEVPDPVLASGPDASGLDAIVRVTAACVCGSDLWGYRGISPVAEAPRPWGPRGPPAGRPRRGGGGRSSGGWGRSPGTPSPRSSRATS